MGEESKALDALDEALRLDPELWDALFDLGRMLDKAGMSDKAFPVYDEFLEAIDEGKREKDDKYEHALNRYREIREEVEAARKSGGFWAKLFGKK
ncbi:hypothetical protein D3C78_1410060 [compost metagenome]